MILGTQMATVRDITQIIPALFRRLRVHERVLRQNQLQINFLTTELRQIRTRRNPVDTTGECLAALESLGPDAGLSECSMGLCADPQDCPFRSACEGSAPTPSSVAKVFPPIPTEQIG